MIKVIEIQKDGIVYERCKGCNEKLNAFRSKEKHPSPESGELMYHKICGLQLAFAKGFTLKRFTIC